jgi:hypothetical protein
VQSPGDRLADNLFFISALNQMQIKITSKQSYSLIEILGGNGEPASPQNPISVEEYQSVEFPEGNGQLAVISGMPASALCLLTAYYKNLFGAIAIANPRNGVAEIIHSVNPSYKMGTVIPLQ